MTETPTKSKSNLLRRESQINGLLENEFHKYFGDGIENPENVENNENNENLEAMDNKLSTPDFNSINTADKKDSEITPTFVAVKRKSITDFDTDRLYSDPLNSSTRMIPKSPTTSPKRSRRTSNIFFKSGGTIFEDYVDKYKGVLAFMNGVVRAETKMPDQIKASEMYINFKLLECATALFTLISNIYALLRYCLWDILL
jgi:hypothetical protein